MSQQCQQDTVIPAEISILSATSRIILTLLVTTIIGMVHRYRRLVSSRTGQLTDAGTTNGTWFATTNN